MITPEKKIQWHPTKRHRFMVGGGSSIGQIKVYDWDGKSEVNEVTTLGDLQHMRCFAISPHPYDTDLIAVGNGLGKVDLMRFSGPHPANTVRSPLLVTLPVRTSRACNTVAFSRFDPNYLAVGLDKVRGEPSLVIWDVEVAASSLIETPGQPQKSFLRPQPLLPQSAKNDKYIWQHWSHNEVVTSITFLPHASNLLVAGVSQRWLRLFDLRESYSQTNPLSTNTKSVHGLRVDPFDSNRFASFADDGCIRIWDSRRFSAPLLTITERDAIADGASPRGPSLISDMEYCNSRRGLLASLEKDSSIVRFWNTIRATMVDEREGNTPEPVHEEATSSKISKLARLPWTSTISEPQPSMPKQPIRVEQVILCNTRASPRFLRPLSSFVFIPDNFSRSSEFSIAVVTKDGDLDMHTMHDAPQPQWSSRGEISIGSGKLTLFYRPNIDEGPISDPWEVIPAVPRSQIASPFGSLRSRQGVPNEATTVGIYASSNALEVSYTGVNVPTSPKRFPSDRPPLALDATPRPGQLLLKEEQESHERRGRNQERVEKSTVRPSSKGKLSSDERTGRRAISDDISMVIRRRAVKGYGLENLVHNSNITRVESSHSETLVELWLWIENSKHILSDSSRVHGYEFAYQGVHGIWEGFPATARSNSLEQDSDLELARQDLAQSLFVLPEEEEDGYRTPGRHRSRRLHRRTQSPGDLRLGDFAAAVHSLNLRSSYDRSNLAKVSASTVKLAQRRFCLTLCGWNYGDGEFVRAAARWEKEGRLTKAACWLLFTGHQDKAIECLMRSDDERLRIMSGTIAALLASRGTSNQLREHYNRLIVRIEDPYLRVMLTHVALDDWSEVLQEESLPLRERLAIAFRFLDDRSLSTYLRGLNDKFRSNGDIEGLVLTGLTPKGFDIIQAYVDATGDVQTASILATLVCPAMFKDSRADRWLEGYHTLLDGWKLFHHRCQFDISRGKLIKEAIAREDIPAFDWVPPQLVVRCGFCKKVISARTPMAGVGTRIRVNSCQTCGRSLPRCSICLTILGIGLDSARDAELGRGPEAKDTIDESLVFCQTCKHGGHLSHILEWFYGNNGGQLETKVHDECPVAGCNCRCALE